MQLSCNRCVLGPQFLLSMAVSPYLISPLILDVPIYLPSVIFLGRIIRFQQALRPPICHHAATLALFLFLFLFLFFPFFSDPIIFTACALTIHVPYLRHASRFPISDLGAKEEPTDH
ncbi:hypothetical protein F4779DRAFT_592420 [Xylariaceae sp. FL0662B]|nr:hypothetical protein F4779DRAFT_592420 [Xylariaceae sp. FL0662B]